MLSYLNNNINFHISVFFGTGPATRINEQFSKFTSRRCVRQLTAIFLAGPGGLGRIMANIKTEDEIITFEREMKEFWTKLKSVYGTEQINQTLTLRDSCKESIKALSEKWSKRLKEGDVMLDKIQDYNNEIRQQSQQISENQEHFREIKSEVNQKEEQKKDLTASIQEVKEELMKRKEIISSKNKANKERVERLCKSKVLFEERLGLEIRKIHNEQLQFIFRHIDHKDPDKPFMFTLSINEKGDYEVTSCAPPLDCIEEFQRKVRETNNFSAFIANIRKAFTALSYKQSA
ncbi:kinetochore protein Spc25 [Patagioenas fasciata monilis]|uniref:Kinetochore protein SPC25 n=2 Tax=Patagioenas fasciata TaxID=372321 RepID=A0A1V4K6L1_PATFA|nr:kinetochore protein Spc25 [Patagioenas fasciata monilis]